MNIILRPRGAGKTTDAIKICAENHAYMIVMNQKRATEVFHHAKKIGYDIPFPLTFEEFLEGHYHPAGVKKVFIDDLDLLLRYLHHPDIQIIGTTFTEEK